MTCIAGPGLRILAFKTVTSVVGHTLQHPLDILCKVPQNQTLDDLGDHQQGHELVKKVI